MDYLVNNKLMKGQRAVAFFVIRLNPLLVVSESFGHDQRKKRMMLRFSCVRNLWINFRKI